MTEFSYGRKEEIGVYSVTKGKYKKKFKNPEIKLQISKKYSDSVLPIILSTTALILPKRLRFINQGLSHGFSSLKKICEVSDSSNVYS